MSQNKRLLAHLQKGNAVTPLAALNELGIYRLGARVLDLREAGHRIETELVEVTNRFGDTSRIARYTLAAS